MKKLAALAMAMVAICSIAQTPASQFVFDLDVKLDGMIRVGEAPEGISTIIPITGGTVEGPNIHGTIVSGGADYQLFYPSPNISHLNAIYTFRTDDGINVLVNNRGIVSDNYFFATPTFEAPVDSKYAWLNKATFACRPIGFGENQIRLRVWMLKDESEKVYQPKSFMPLPDSAYREADKSGRLEEFVYTAVVYGDTIAKRAQVYLPFGYDQKAKDVRYDVLYLMHGGGDNTTSFFSAERSPLPMTQALDRLIEDGTMEPIIVVAPTFYRDDRNIGANSMEDAITLTRIFSKEMRDYAIPQIESHYNTYLEGSSPEAIAASRQHRAFGGFSMGALATWYQMAYGLDCVSIFIPLSGDLWIYDQDNQKQSADMAAMWLGDKVAASPYRDAFVVYGYSGTKDIAGVPEINLFTGLLRHAPVFQLDSPSPKASLTMKDGGDHWYGDVNQYLYEVLPLLWPK